MLIVRCFIFMCTALGALHEARAEDNATEFVEAGIRLRRAHRDMEALAQFRRAYELDPAPRILVQIGLAEQALGHWVEAERDLLEALRSEDDAWISARAPLLHQSLESIRQHLALLVVESNVAGAEIRINGRVAGKIPLSPVRVPEGRIELEVRPPAGEPVREVVNVTAGTEVVQRIEIRATAAPAPGQSVAATAGATAAGADARAPLAATPHSAGASIVAWGLLGASGVVLGGALAAQVIHERNAAHYNDDALCALPGQSRDQQCGTYRGRAELAQQLAVFGYVGAGVLGLGAATVFLLSRTDRIERARSSSIWVNAGPAAIEAGYAGEF